MSYFHKSIAGWDEMREIGGRSRDGIFNPQNENRYVFNPGKIRELRIKEDSTIKETAERLGISYDILQRIESGQTKMDAGLLGTIAQYFGVSVSYFYDREDYYSAYLPIRNLKEQPGSSADDTEFEHVIIPHDVDEMYAIIGIIDGEEHLLEEAFHPEENDGELYAVIVNKKIYTNCIFTGKTRTGLRFVSDGKKVSADPKAPDTYIYRDIGTACTPYEAREYRRRTAKERNAK